MPWEQLPGITAALWGSPENRRLAHQIQAAFSSRTEAGHPSQGCRTSPASGHFAHLPS